MCVCKLAPRNCTGLIISGIINYHLILALLWQQSPGVRCWQFAIYEIVIIVNPVKHVQSVENGGLHVREYSVVLLHPSTLPADSITRL